MLGRCRNAVAGIFGAQDNRLGVGHISGIRCETDFICHIGVGFKNAGQRPHTIAEHGGLAVCEVLYAVVVRGSQHVSVDEALILEIDQILSKNSHRTICCCKLELVLIVGQESLLSVNSAQRGLDVTMRQELNQVAKVPSLTTEDEPRSNIRFFLLDGLQHGFKVCPFGRELGITSFAQNILVVEETGHRHVRADTIDIARAYIRASGLHIRGHTIPELVQVRDVHVLAFIGKALFVGGHNVRHFVGGEFDLDDVAGIFLIFLLNNDMILRSVELINDFVHHIDSFDFAGKELDIYFFTGGFGAFCRRGAFSWGRICTAGCRAAGCAAATGQRAAEHCHCHRHCSELTKFHSILPSLCDLNFKLIGLKFGKSFGSAPSLCLYCTTVVIVINTQNFR